MEKIGGHTYIKFYWCIAQIRIPCSNDPVRCTVCYTCRYMMMQLCWSQSPDGRPTFDVLVGSLEVIAGRGHTPPPPPPPTQPCTVNHNYAVLEPVTTSSTSEQELTIVQQQQQQGCGRDCTVKETGHLTVTM